MIESNAIAPFYVSVTGPTASGKSDFALKLAQHFNGVLINCDSVQLYKGFDIGSAKPSASEQQIAPHFLYDCFDWEQNCDAVQYAEMAKKIILEAHDRGELPILVGGTGLYLRALAGDQFHDLPSDPHVKKTLELEATTSLYERLEKKDPLRARQIHKNDRYRIVRALEINILSGSPVHVYLSNAQKKSPFASSFNVFLNPERCILHKRIAMRIDQMFASGFVEEVRGLIEGGCPATAKPMESIGYKQVCEFLLESDQSNLDDLKNRVLFATRQYAKRQITWFKKGFDLHHLQSDSEALSNTIEAIESIRKP